jgi:hypothetical protein
VVQTASLKDQRHSTFRAPIYSVPNGGATLWRLLPARSSTAHQWIQTSDTSVAAHYLFSLGGDMRWRSQQQHTEKSPADFFCCHKRKKLRDVTKIPARLGRRLLEYCSASRCFTPASSQFQFNTPRRSYPQKGVLCYLRTSLAFMVNCCRYRSYREPHYPAH